MERLERERAVLARERAALARELDEVRKIVQIFENHFDVLGNCSMTYIHHIKAFQGKASPRGTIKLHTHHTHTHTHTHTCLLGRATA